MTHHQNLGLTSFYILPRQLFDSSCPLSLEAKVLFALILDRTDLSIKNDWRDKDGKIYIYYTIEEAQEKLGYGRSKIIRIFKELENNKYIIRKKQGLGKPSRVYINSWHFISDTSEEARNERLESIRDFYRRNNLELPESFK